MAHAWSNDQPIAEPVHSPRTHIATLSTGDPGRTYTLLYQGMKQYGGHCESVTDEESYQAMHLLAKLEGLSVEPAAAVAVAGLIKMARRGQVKPGDVVVINCTGHTLPVEPAILGQGWARRLAFSDARASLISAATEAATPGEQAVLREAASRSAATAPEEGLLAALSISAANFGAAKSEPFPEPSRIVIVDDHADARRLIRRIIQSHTSALGAASARAGGEETYQFFEAEDGYEAIQIIQRELPDLIILDLMMPEMDGFAVLDALKAEPQTASIPVIVVTAKELSSQEYARLRGQIHSLMQKGEFMNDDLLDEVLSAVLSERPGSRERSG
jgi:threonine synthase